MRCICVRRSFYLYCKTRHNDQRHSEILVFIRSFPWHKTQTLKVCKVIEVIWSTENPQLVSGSDCSTRGNAFTGQRRHCGKSGKSWVRICFWDILTRCSVCLARLSMPYKQTQADPRLHTFTRSSLYNSRRYERWMRSQANAASYICSLPVYLDKQISMAALVPAKLLARKLAQWTTGNNRFHFGRL